METTPSWSLKDLGRVYLDHNATTPPLRSIVEQTPEWLSRWGNPSSIHQTGRGPKNLMREARLALARLIGCHPLEIIFTGSGSEGNNYVIKGMFEQVRLNLRPSRHEFITTNVEHPSVRECFEYIRAQGGVVHELKIARGGELDWKSYINYLSERTALVSVMAANNETGSLLPIQEMARLAHDAGAKFHTDAVQTLGKIPVRVTDWGVDFATFAAHKMYSLKGAGLVYTRKGENLPSLILGGPQERGRRAGTENILAIAAFSCAAREHGARIVEHSARMGRLRDWLEQEITTQIAGVTVNGAGVNRIPNTSSLVIAGVDGESLLMNLDLEGASVSTGAACASGSPEPSPVLIAMGLTRREAQSSLRLSLGWDTTEDELALFLATLKRVVHRLRTVSENFAASPEAQYG